VTIAIIDAVIGPLVRFPLLILDHFFLERDFKKIFSHCPGKFMNINPKVVGLRLGKELLGKLPSSFKITCEIDSSHGASPFGFDVVLATSVG